MSQREITLETISNEIQKTIQDNIAEFYLIIPSIYKIENKIVMNYEITTKMLEVSEICSSGLTDLDEEYSEEELEKMFYECYKEQLDEINSEYAFHNAILKTKEFSIKITPIKCGGDYCNVGGELEIEIYTTDIQYIHDILLPKIKNAIELLISLS